MLPLHSRDMKHVSRNNNNNKYQEKSFLLQSRRDSLDRDDDDDNTKQQTQKRVSVTADEEKLLNAQKRHRECVVLSFAGVWSTSDWEQNYVWTEAHTTMFRHEFMSDDFAKY